MKPRPREVVEGLQDQGEDETWAYQVRTWDQDANGAYVNPASVSQVKAYSLIDGAKTDVSIATLSGSPSVNGRIITCPGFGNGGITAGVDYVLEILYVVNGNTAEVKIRIKCTL